MPHHTRALAVLALLLPLALGYSRTAGDQRVSEAEGQAPVPTPGHPPVTVSGVVASYDPATGILTFEDGRMVKLTSQSKVVRGINAVRPGERVVVHDVLPVSVPTEKTRP